MVELIKQKIVIFDGAMGTEIQRRVSKKLTAQFGDLLNIENPQVIEDIHLSYINAGCDVIETNTFNSNPLVLSKWNKEGICHELNIRAVEIAKSAVKKSGKKIFIAGSVGPCDVSASLDDKPSFDELKKSYALQIEALLKGGVDFIIFETFHDIVNLKSGIIALIDIIDRKDNLPAIASVTVDKNGFMLCGHDTISAYHCIEHFEIIAFGLNCSTGPIEMGRHISELSRISRFPVFVMPNAGSPDENGVYSIGSKEFADIILGYAKSGYLNIVGGCCGTQPKHIEMISSLLADQKPRALKDNRFFSISHKISFSENDVQMPYIISERTNTLGSRRFREMVEKCNVNGVIEMARNEIEKGVHALDVSFISRERVEIDDVKMFFPHMCRLLKNPFCIDSTDPDVFEFCAKVSGSKLIFNSVNFEKGIDIVKRVMDIAIRYGANVVFGLIWSDGDLPVSLEEKMRNAQRIYDFIVKENFPLHLVIFDPLVFPLASSKHFCARDTIFAVCEIKKRFSVKTLLGISNVSYGLPLVTRKYINSIFLNHAIEKGLDLAIINPSDRISYPDIDNEIKMICNSIIMEGKTELITKLVEITSKMRRDEKNEVIPVDPIEHVKVSIIKGSADLETLLKKLISQKSAIDIINEAVIPAMDEVGRMFSEGKYIITDVLLSASIAKKIINWLEPYILKSGLKKAKLLIATVKGDVHDIGKNLVSIVFNANGFDVIDLGVRVEPNIIVEKAVEIKPHVIGLSGLLVKSTEYMIETAHLLKRKELDIPLIVGGAGVSQRFVDLKMKEIYPYSFYAKDAVEGVEIAKSAILKRRV
ncbi:MAG: homocysteine S-methyltransferase family protein [Elusimicrobiales bacterium]